MHIRSFQEFVTEDALGFPAAPFNEHQERAKIHSRFPLSLIVEGDYPEFDLAVRWCWQHFGFMQGECWSGSQYPACPLVLSTERVGQRVSPQGKIYAIKTYEQVASHCHWGAWSIFFLGKTDYDHGFGEFYFRTEAQRNRFAEFVPQVDWGENYPWLRELP